MPDPKSQVEAQKSGIKIGELIKQTGVTRATVHHYVRMGLLPEPLKTSRNMALYDPTCIDRVLLIKGLVSKTRRTLAEVKELLENAAGHEGVKRLQNMFEMETIAARSSQIQLSGGSIELPTLLEETGFRPEHLQEFHQLGLVNIEEVDGVEQIAGADIEVIRALAHLAEVGFDDVHGFKAKDAVMYLDAMRNLLHREVELFLATTPKGSDTSAVLQKAELGIERVNPLLLAFRRKLIQEFVRAALPSLGSTTV